MTRTVSATEARVHFGKLLRGIAEEGATYVVERDGQEIAVVLPVDEYQRLTSRTTESHWRARLKESQELFRQTFRGKDLPDPDELINLGREERDSAIFGDLLRRESDISVGNGNESGDR